MTEWKDDHQKPLYVAPRMSSLTEEDIAVGLGPVLLSGNQTLEPVSALGAAAKYGGTDPADLIQTTPQK